MNGVQQSRTRSPTTVLVGLLVLTNCVLAFMVVTFSGDLSRIKNQSATQQSVQAVNERVTNIEQAILAVGRSAGTQQGPSVSQVANDLEDLERAVFGLGGPGLEDDAIGELRSCVNRLGSALSSGNRFPPRC